MADTPDEKSFTKVNVSPVRATVKDGIPHYMGLAGERLITAITVVATLGAFVMWIVAKSLTVRCPGFLLFGYDQGVVGHPLISSRSGGLKSSKMSGIIAAPQFYRVFPDLDPDLVGHKHSSTMQAFYTAIYELGCLAGAIFALLWGNKIGRRRNIMIGLSSVQPVTSL